MNIIYKRMDGIWELIKMKNVNIKQILSWIGLIVLFLIFISLLAPMILEYKERAEDEIPSTQKMEELLGLEEDTLVSKEDLEIEVKKWAEVEGWSLDDVMYDFDVQIEIEDKIRNKYGDLNADAYIAGTLVTDHMNADEVRQLAVHFPNQNLQGNIAHPFTEPVDIITSELFEDMEKDKNYLYGGENDYVDYGEDYDEDYDWEYDDEYDDDEYDDAYYKIKSDQGLGEYTKYFKETQGFIEIDKGINIGYFDLSYPDYIYGEQVYTTNEEMLKHRGISSEIREQLLGSTIEYLLIFDKDMRINEVRDKIEKVKINGNDGLDIFDQFTEEWLHEVSIEEENVVFFEGTFLRVTVPVNMEEIFKKESETDEIEEIIKGEKRNPIIEVNERKIVLEEITEEDIESGITVFDNLDIE